MVSQVEHRFTKTGKPLEQLPQDYQIALPSLFGEDYPKYKAYMTEGWFLYAQCRVQERKWKEGVRDETCQCRITLRDKRKDLTISRTAIRTE